VRLGPSSVDSEVFAQVFPTAVESREHSQQRVADLTEEDTDCHVELPAIRLALARVEQLIKDKSGHHRLHEQESDVHQQVEENVVGVAEDGPVEDIGRSRWQQQQDGE